MASLPFCLSRRLEGASLLLLSYRRLHAAAKKEQPYTLPGTAVKGAGCCSFMGI